MISIKDTIEALEQYKEISIKVLKEGVPYPNMLWVGSTSPQQDIDICERIIKQYKDNDARTRS